MGLLKNAYTLRILEGDLLILQDTSELLRELTTEEIESIDSIETTPSYSGSSATAAASRTTTTTTYCSSFPSRSRSGGVKIKTHSDRLREEENKSRSTTSTTDDSVKNDVDVYGSVMLEKADASVNGDGNKDKVEFEKQGGAALFADLL